MKMNNSVICSKNYIKDNTSFIIDIINEDGSLRSLYTYSDLNTKTIFLEYTGL